MWLSKEKTGKRGASHTYSDLAIETVATIKSIYSLAGRQAVGLVESVFELTGLDLAVPEHSTLSRRLAALDIKLPTISKEGARHVVIDATGIKVYGEGEWKTRQHGISKRRTWRKLHLALDEGTGEMLAVEVSLNNKKDSQLLDTLLGQIDDELEQVSADGAYDSRESTKRFRNVKPELLSHLVRTRKSGNTATVSWTPTLVTRTYALSENMDVLSGNALLTITAARLPKPLCSASRLSLVTKPPVVSFKTRLLNSSSSAKLSTK